MMRALLWPFLALRAWFLRWAIWEAESYLLACAEDVRPRGQRGVRYSKAWNGLQLREGLTAEEIIEACIWAPGGADLRQAMHTLRERLRDQVRRQLAQGVEA